MKKNLLKPAIVLCLAVFTFACSKEMIQNESTKTVTLGEPLLLTKSETIALSVKQKGTYKISKTEALEKLSRYAAARGNNATIQISSTTLKTNPVTGKEMYYEVVFESEKGTGFSLVAADERLDEILCFVEQGNLKDTLELPMIQVYFRQMHAYIKDETSKELDIHSLCESANNKLSAEHPSTKAIPPFDPNVWTFSHSKTVITGGVVTKSVPVKWGQKTFTAGAAGCSTIAVAQVMAYWKKNYKSIITSSTTWSAIISNYDHQTAITWLTDMYDELYNVMGISWLNVPPFMSELRSFMVRNGYTCGSVHSGYSFDVLQNAIRNFGPTIISGVNIWELNGHCWVVDGINDQRTQYIDVYTYNYNGTILVHEELVAVTGGDHVQFNWGQYGQWDGWYSSGVLSYNGNQFYDWVRIISSIN